MFLLNDSVFLYSCARSVCIVWENALAEEVYETYISHYFRIILRMLWRLNRDDTIFEINIRRTNLHGLLPRRPRVLTRDKSFSSTRVAISLRAFPGRGKTSRPARSTRSVRYIRKCALAKRGSAGCENYARWLHAKRRHELPSSSAIDLWIVFLVRIHEFIAAILSSIPIGSSSPSLFGFGRLENKSIDTRVRAE